MILSAASVLWSELEIAPGFAELKKASAPVTFVRLQRSYSRIVPDREDCATKINPLGSKENLLIVIQYKQSSQSKQMASTQC